MVLVNNGGGPDSYHQLQHSKWDGWTLTDFIFPSFLWMVGIAITLSLSKRLGAGVSRLILVRQVVRRSLTLFALGLLVYLYPDFHFSTMRILGVLQRIAICYLVSSCIYLVTGLSGQILSILGLLIAYWLLMTFVPVPGHGAGHFDLNGNVAHWVDRVVLGKHNYQGGSWDPEGIVSTLPAIASTMLGVVAGHLLRLKTGLPRKLLWMGLTGAALVCLGLFWSQTMPINKKLWTGSFALLMAGLDFLLFAAFAWLVDGLGLERQVKPFVVLGMNAIAVYLFSEFLASTLDWIDLHDWLYNHVFARLASPLNASLLYAIAIVLITYLFAYVLYRRNWFWRV